MFSDLSALRTQVQKQKTPRQTQDVKIKIVLYSIDHVPK